MSTRISVSSVETPSWRRWLRAIDPPIYVVGLLPPLVGAASTLSTASPFPLSLWFFPILGFLLLHGATNVANDAFDAATRADRVKRHSMARLAAPNSLLAAAAILVALAAACGLFPWLRHPSWTVPLLSTVGVVLLYVYHGPPLRLSHRGWGELVTFFGFGPIPLWATAALGDGWIPGSAVLPGILVGLAAVVVLVHHNLASRESDGAAGKRTLAVRFGTSGAELYAWGLEAALCLGVASLWSGTIAAVGVAIVVGLLAVVAHVQVSTGRRMARAASLGLYATACGLVLLHLVQRGGGR